MSDETHIPTDPEVAKAAADADPPEDNRWKDAVREIFSASPWVAVGALVLAFVVGSIMIAFTDSRVQEVSAWFFQRPGDTFSALGSAIGRAYSQLFQGAVFNVAFAERGGFLEGIRPLMSTLTSATPLIAAGLGVAVSFRAGMFNIGGRGQMIFAAIAAGWLGYVWSGLPFPLLLIICVVAGVLAGALWSGLAGFLKAKTGAHEVIATIMLNYIAFYFLQWLLMTPGMLRGVKGTPISNPVPDAAFPLLFGSRYTVSWAFVVSLAAVAFCWWLLNRSSMGFAFRAIGENPRAAKVAGINVERTMVVAMMVAGALVGLAGTQQALGVLASSASATRSTRASDSTPSPSPCWAGRSRSGSCSPGCSSAPSRRVAARCSWCARRHLDRRRHPVRDRAVHRGAAAGPRDLPASAALAGCARP